jgi:hypothetical protein
VGKGEISEIHQGSGTHKFILPEASRSLFFFLPLFFFIVSPVLILRRSFSSRVLIIKNTFYSRGKVRPAQSFRGWSRSRESFVITRIHSPSPIVSPLLVRTLIKNFHAFCDAVLPRMFARTQQTRMHLYLLLLRYSYLMTHQSPSVRVITRFGLINRFVILSGALRSFIISNNKQPCIRTSANARLLLICRYKYSIQPFSAINCSYQA